jgi:hypothetical protein
MSSRCPQLQAKAGFVNWFLPDALEKKPERFLSKISRSESRLRLVLNWYKRTHGTAGINETCNGPV